MRKLYFYKNHYGILDETNNKIYWVKEDLSPIWSEYVFGQKSMYFSSLHKEELLFICELDFDYVHVTDNGNSESLD